MRGRWEEPAVSEWERRERGEQREKEVRFRNVEVKRRERVKRIWVQRRRSINKYKIWWLLFSRKLQGIVRQESKWTTPHPDVATCVNSSVCVCVRLCVCVFEGRVIEFYSAISIFAMVVLWLTTTIIIVPCVHAHVPPILPVLPHLLSTIKCSWCFLTGMKYSIWGSFNMWICSLSSLVSPYFSLSELHKSWT